MKINNNISRGNLISKVLTITLPHNHYNVYYSALDSRWPLFQNSLNLYVVTINSLGTGVKGTVSNTMKTIWLEHSKILLMNKPNPQRS